MPPRFTVQVSLDCCGTQHAVTFDHDDYPVLPQNCYRTNLACSACDQIVILTMREQPNGQQEVSQEVLA